MNIDELPAGPELDDLVATRVMGWKRETKDFDGGSWTRWNRPGESGTWHPANPVLRGEDWFSPSTNIAHAFEVVEKIRDRFHVHLEANGTSGWHCVLNGDWTTADTLPLAISRAALKAVKS